MRTFLLFLSLFAAGRMVGDDEIGAEGYGFIDDGGGEVQGYQHARAFAHWVAQQGTRVVVILLIFGMELAVEKLYEPKRGKKGGRRMFFCTESKIKRIFAKSKRAIPRQTKQQNVEQKQNTTELKTYR